MLADRYALNARPLGLGVLLIGVMILLGLMEAAMPAPLPVALTSAVLLTFVAVCLVSLEAAITVILAVTPFSVEVLVPGSGSALQLPTEPMIFLVILIWSVRCMVRPDLRMPQPAFVGALSLALLACLVSLIDSPTRLLGAKATANAVWYALIGVFVFSNFASRERLRWLTAAWLVPGVIICLYSIVNVLMGHYNRLAGFWWSSPFFTEHGTFSAYLSFVSALSLALTLETKGPPRLLFGLIAMLSTGQVILSLTRGAWLGLVALGLFLIVVSARRLMRPANIALLGLGAVVILGLVQLSGAGYGLARHSQTLTDPAYVSNLERLNRWQAAYNMFRADPITGIGFGGYADAYRNFRRIPLSTDQSTHHMSVHSEYLKVAAETGVIGLAAAAGVFVLLVTMAGSAIRRTTDPFLRALAVGMAGGLLTYLVHALVNNYMVYDKTAVPVWVAIGTLGAIDRMNRE